MFWQDQNGELLFAVLEERPRSYPWDPHLPENQMTELGGSKQYCLATNCQLGLKSEQEDPTCLRAEVPVRFHSPEEERSKLR